MTSGPPEGTLRWCWDAQLEVKSGVSEAMLTAFLERMNALAAQLGSGCDARGSPTLWEIRLDSLAIEDGNRLVEWFAQQPELKAYRLGPSGIAT